MRWIALLLLLAPMAQAQTPTSAFAVESEVPALLAPDAITEIPWRVTVGCMDIIEAGGEYDVHVHAEGLPVDEVETHFGFESCIGAESVTKNGTFIVDTRGLPGLAPFPVVVEATGPDATTTTEPVEVTVGYRPGHTMTPNGDQLFLVDGASHSFDLVLNITANAKTMVMFENKVVSGSASLSGLRAQIFDVAAGNTGETRQITFQAPEGSWTEETVTFYTYSHCLDGDDCGDQFAQNITWTFQNTAPETQSEPVAEESPGVGIILVVALVGLTLARRH